MHNQSKSHARLYTSGSLFQILQKYILKIERRSQEERSSINFERRRMSWNNKGHQKWGKINAPWHRRSSTFQRAWLHPAIPRWVPQQHLRPPLKSLRREKETTLRRQRERNPLLTTLGAPQNPRLRNERARYICRSNTVFAMLLDGVWSRKGPITLQLTLFRPNYARLPKQKKGSKHNRTKKV